MQDFCPRINMLKEIFLNNILRWIMVQSQFSMSKILFFNIMSNFWWTGAPLILKIQWFPLSVLIFGQKCCFLGPTIFKIPQPNWYQIPQFPKLYYILDFCCIQWDLVYLCNNVSRFVIVDFTTTTSYIFSRKKFKVNNPILVLSLIYPIPIYNTPTTQHIIDWSNHTF